MTTNQGHRRVRPSTQAKGRQAHRQGRRHRVGPQEVVLGRHRRWTGSSRKQSWNCTSNASKKWLRRIMPSTRRRSIELR
eukprot:1511148-Heterocapsa_arctica.AAC.1